MGRCSISHVTLLSLCNSQDAPTGRDLPDLVQHLPFSFFSLIFFLNYFILFYLFLAALGLLCCVQAISSCGERGLLFIAVHGLPVAVASLVAEHGL